MPRAVPIALVRFGPIAGSCALVSILALPLGAQCELELFGPPDGEISQFFGTAVDVDGTVAAVGAPGRDPFGAVVVLRRVGGDWVEEQVITGDASPERSELGDEVAVRDDRIVIGLPDTDGACPGDPGCNSGSVLVYLFDGAQWVEEQLITLVDAEGGDQFGRTVAIDGDRILVGAPMKGPAGAAVMFHRVGGTWVEVIRLPPQTSNFPPERHGRSVALDGDLALVGDPIVTFGAVRAYRFDGAAWTFVEELEHDFGGQYGLALDLAGDRAIVGDPGAGPGGLGRAWMYAWDGATFVLEGTIESIDQVPDEGHGSAVAIDGDWAAIGSPGDPFGPDAPGSATIFHRAAATWVESAEVVPSGLDDFSRFGTELAISGDSLWVGALRDDGFSTNGGAVYRFGLGAACPIVSYIRGDENADGAVDIADAIGLLARLFGSPEPPSACPDALDVNDDGGLDVADPIALLSHLFGALSPPNLGACEDDATPDPLPDCIGSSCP